MGAVRIFTVALPLILVVCSIIAMLFTALSGVSHDQLWLVQVDLTKLSINPADAYNGTNGQGHDLVKAKNNIMVGDLGLGSVYEVNVWGYCYTKSDGHRHCTKTRFDWASSSLDDYRTEGLDSTASTKITLPKEIKDSLDLFRHITKGAQVALITCLLALGVMLVVGVFGLFSATVSYLPSILACITVVLVCSAAGLVSAMAAIVMEAVETHARVYGVAGNTGARFLAIPWIGVVLVIASAVIWLVTACCSKSSRRRERATFHAARSDKAASLP